METGTIRTVPETHWQLIILDGTDNQLLGCDEARSETD